MTRAPLLDRLRDAAMNRVLILGPTARDLFAEAADALQNAADDLVTVAWKLVRPGGGDYLVTMDRDSANELHSQGWALTELCERGRK